jgi:hypothetical protein
MQLQVQCAPRGRELPDNSQSARLRSAGHWFWFTHFLRAAQAATVTLLATAPLVAATAAEEQALPTAQAPQANPEAFLAALRSKVPIDPITIQANPYLTAPADSPAQPPRDVVCGVRFEPDQVHYRLSRFPSAAAAHTAGFAVTHFGACGTCSTLRDLAVYLEKRDLTAPVRKCGIKWDASARLACLKDLGFSTPCAQTWLYDVENTRHYCLSVCLKSWIEEEPPTGADGRLNACLQCDEDRSGPVFKATSGRTRRNSGIRSSIPRPNDEIAPVVHDYVPGFAAQ